MYALDFLILKPHRRRINFAIALLAVVLLATKEETNIIISNAKQRSNGEFNHYTADGGDMAAIPQLTWLY